jgi:hypothetical protein
MWSAILAFPHRFNLFIFDLKEFLGHLKDINDKKMNELKFVQKGPEGNLNTVELWSTIRIPFEPKGEIKDLRDSLSNSIKKIQPSINSILYASYVADHTEYCDVENVLLYNIGTGTFKNLCQEGLCFEKKIGFPPKNPFFFKYAPHYYSYKVADLNNPFKFWKKGKTLFSWSNINSPAFKSNTKLDSYWYALKTEKFDMTGMNERFDAFGLDLRINVPSGTKINVAAVIKPLLDGIVSVFHVHDGSDITFLSKCIADRTGKGQRNIADLLVDPKLAILGRRNLLHRWGDSIQWNPSDDLCLAVKVLVNDSLERDKWQFSGDLFTLSPRIEN